jgi:hypothetical protein
MGLVALCGYPLADLVCISGLDSLGAIYCVGIGLDHWDWEYTAHSLRYHFVLASFMLVNQV